MYQGPVVYCITCTANQKKYWGSTISFKKRYQEHSGFLKRGNHPNAIMQKCWNKYGENSFLFEIVTRCDVSKLIDIEQTLLDKHWGTPLCMNLAKDAQASARGIKRGPQSQIHINKRTKAVCKGVIATNITTKERLVFQSRKEAGIYFDTYSASITYRIRTQQPSQNRFSKLAGWLFENLKRE